MRSLTIRTLKVSLYSVYCPPDQDQKIDAAKMKSALADASKILETQAGVKLDLRSGSTTPASLTYSNDTFGKFFDEKDKWFAALYGDPTPKRVSIAEQKSGFNVFFVTRIKQTVSGSKWVDPAGRYYRLLADHSTATIVYNVILISLLKTDDSNRHRALAHEIGHGLWKTPQGEIHSSTEGNLMFAELPRAGDSLDDDQAKEMNANADRVSKGQP